jgi:2-polyprenyl-3-methyl-5-hydroxy-6-metoxy-1,4-benzoquinol methylase
MIKLQTTSSSEDLGIHQFDSCILCESTTLKRLQGYEKDYLVRCNSCHFVFCKRKPTLGELKAHYELYLRNELLSEITSKRYEELLDKFEVYRKTNNIIDVGCGDGLFLEAAKKRKWNVFGTEFTEEALKICEKKGIKMTSSPLDSTAYQADFFDVVTSFEVIEHINTPLSEIESFKTILRKGGLLYITTPNFNSISRDIKKGKWSVIEYPEHLSYYTKETLTLLVKQFGFKSIVVTATGISLRRLGANSSSANSTHANSDEWLRQQTEEKVIYKWLKKGVNTALDITGKGDALKGFFQKQ